MKLRKRKLARLLNNVADLYDGEQKLLSIDLDRRVEITQNKLIMNGHGRSGAMVQELQRVYREGLRSHEELLRESLQRVLKSNRFAGQPRVRPFTLNNLHHSHPSGIPATSK